MEWLEIFDISLFRSLIRSATPIALIGFGAAMCSASGVLNIGLEGKMLNAAFVGIAASYYSGSALTGFIWGVCWSAYGNFIWCFEFQFRCR